MSTTSTLKAVYQQWCDAVAAARGNSNSVLALYAPDAIIAATFNKTLLKDLEQKQRYFKVFTSLTNLKVATKAYYEHVFDDFATTIGIYSFVYEKEDKIEEVDVRFSFSYAKKDGTWLIINHHSSALPTVSLAEQA